MSYALITGSSKGIGRSLAFELAKRNYDILLIARSERELKEVADSLIELYNIKAHYLAIDLSDNDAPTRVKNWCLENNYQVSILVNNAGYALWGWFHTIGIKEQLNMMQLNMHTMVDLTYQMLPILKANKKAYILNLGSTAAYQAISAFTIYASTKAFVLQFSRGLKMELRSSNVSVTCVCPGGVASNFIERAGMQAMQSIADKVNMDSEVVAKFAINGMFKGKAEIIPGFINLISSKLTYFFPKFMAEKIAASLYEKHLK